MRYSNETKTKNNNTSINLYRDEIPIAGMDFLADEQEIIRYDCLTSR